MFIEMFIESYQMKMKSNKNKQQCDKTNIWSLLLYFEKHKKQ